MDTARFGDDVERIPEALGGLADAVSRGLPGLDALPEVPDRTRVLVLGMGSSAYAAAVVAREARAVGFAVTAELASTTMLPPPASDQLVIAISATGESAEVLHAARHYAGTGRLIAVTNRVDSALAEMADVAVPLLAGVEASGVACRTFRHTFLVLAEVLGAYGARFSSPADRLARGAAGANQALLDARYEWVGPVAETLLGPGGTFVMAPAERLSSAQQASLMIREVPRRPAFASETGDWSHVDVYLTRTLDYRALVFAGSEWDTQALEWMKQRGSRFVAVGGDLPRASHTVRYPGDTDRMTATLTETLVGELVAWEWYRSDPTFRWADNRFKNSPS